jgi:hypothetical protein
MEFDHSMFEDEMVGFQELMQRFEKFVGAVTQRTMAEVLQQPKV